MLRVPVPRPSLVSARRTSGPFAPSTRSRDSGVGPAGRQPGQGLPSHDLHHREGRGSDLLQGLGRSEEHTSELKSLMRISYAVFCLKKKNNKQQSQPHPCLHTRTNRYTRTSTLI